MRRSAILLGFPLVIIAGCAQASPSGPVVSPQERREAFQQRADEVAQAWRVAPGRDAWQAGYAPLEGPALFPGDPAFTTETEQAFHAGWYQTAVALPTDPPAEGTVEFTDGTLAVPLVSAADAYQQLDQGDPPPCPTGPPPAPAPGEPSGGPDTSERSSASACLGLTVTGVELGTAAVLTSRGEAQVPAWLFEVEELASPVARLAVADSAAVSPPSPEPPQPAILPGVVGAQDLTEVGGATLDLRLGVGACDTEITPLVREYADVVVLGGEVTRTDGVCTEQLVMYPVTVTLEDPVAARTVLDAMTGHPLTVTAG